MKKSIKKVLLTCAAASAVVFAMSATAMAADATYSSGTITTNADLSAVADGKQVTIIVTEKGKDVNPANDDILYINQVSKDATTFATIPVDPTKIDSTKDYVIKIGGETLSSIITINLKGSGGSTGYILGDINNSGEVNVSDAVGIVNHITGDAVLTGDALKAADTNADSDVNVSDAVNVVKYITGDPSPVDGVTTAN